MDSEARNTKLVLMVLFGIAVAISSRWAIDLKPFDYVLIGLAVMRLGRIIAFEGIFEPIRAYFAHEEKHEHYGTTTEPSYFYGWRHSIGELITCPMCAATWATLMISIGLCLIPEIAWRFVTIMGAVGIMEIAHSLVEALCWSSAASRKETGSAKDD